jgi:hypothetical protein
VLNVQGLREVVVAAQDGEDVVEQIIPLLQLSTRIWGDR